MNREVMGRLLHLVSVGRITVVDDSGPVQRLQVKERPGADGSPGLTDNVLRVSQFGFSSSPPATSDVVLIRLWGNRTLAIAIGSNHQPSRPTGLTAGASVLYSLFGQKVWLSAEQLVVDGGGLPVVIKNFSTCTVEGDLTVTGKLNAAGEIVSDIGFMVGATPLTVP